MAFSLTASLKILGLRSKLKNYNPRFFHFENEIVGFCFFLTLCYNHRCDDLQLNNRDANFRISLQGDSLVEKVEPDPLNLSVNTVVGSN